MEVIRINCKEYNKQNLHSFPRDEEWQQEIYDFLLAFFDESVSEIEFQTSGTTGTPKKIRFSKEQIRKSAEITSNYFNLSIRNTGLLCLPVRYVAGKLMLARAIVSGMELVAVPPTLSPLDTINDIHIDFVAMTPAQVHSTIHDIHSNEKFTRINQVIIGGGEVSPVLEEGLKAYPNQIFATYGMTETLTHVAVRRVGENSYHVLDKAVSFALNEKDCLQVRVPYLYSEPLQTNDIVKLENEYSFQWLGRLDHVVNSGGVKLYPEQIEKQIRESGVLEDREFYVTSIADEKLGQVPALVLGGQEPDNIITVLNTELEAYQRIRKIIIVTELEKTETGKVKRKRF